LGKCDVCLCEPFILPGILPTLGVPTLKAALNDAGITSRVIYPSLRMFAGNRYYWNETFLRCISDIPLQFGEFLFAEGNIPEGIAFLKEHAGIDDEAQIRDFLRAAEEILKTSAEEIAQSGAKILSYSLTFGDYNFAFALFRRVRKLREDITVIVGGSMCTPALTDEILRLCPEIDYCICDDDIGTYTELVREVLKVRTVLKNTDGKPENMQIQIADGRQKKLRSSGGQQECLQSALTEFAERSDTVASAGKPALRVNRITDLNHLPCPDFTDFMAEARRLGLNMDAVIVPYEISRGCWWGEKKSCAMCGYFGYQKCFLIKEPAKVLSEIRQIRDTYGIRYIRFTDLVEPRRDYLKQIEGFRDLGMNFFWELRPNLNEDDISMLKGMGVFYSQIGLESLSTDELKFINKGTTAANNIYLLILFMTYKIRIDWNYLYGFAEDRREWYEEALRLMPCLHHLFAPALRQVWINRESRIYNEHVDSGLTPVGSSIFHEGFPEDTEVFYRSDVNPDLADVYAALEEEIAEWRRDFFRGYQLCVIYDDFEGLHIMRDYGHEEHFYLEGDEAAVYREIFRPQYPDRIEQALGLEETHVTDILHAFESSRIAVRVDGKYLALATRSSQFRWKKYDLLQSIFEGRFEQP